MLKRSGIDREMPSSECVSERRRLMRIRRKDSEQPGAGTVLQQVLKRRLDIDSGGDRELTSCRCDLARRHSKVFEEGLAQARFPKSPAADGKANPIRFHRRLSPHFGARLMRCRKVQAKTPTPQNVSAVCKPRDRFRRVSVRVLRAHGAQAIKPQHSMRFCASYELTA